MMKRLFVVLALMGSVVPASAQGGPPADVASRAKGAGRVVVASITAVRAQFETNQFGDQLIVSHAVLDVLETWKGTPATSLNLAVEGGTVGDLTLKVSDLPSIQEGDRAVFFLDANGNGNHIPHDRGQGIVKLDPTDHVEGSGESLENLREQVRGAVSARGGR